MMIFFIGPVSSAMSIKIISFFSSGGHFVRQNASGCVVNLDFVACEQQRCRLINAFVICFLENNNLACYMQNFHIII